MTPTISILSLYLTYFAITILGLEMGKTSTQNNRNVLMIIIDDLRADHFGAYHERDGASILTPHLDQLSKQDGSVLFSKAYCQYSLCSPSRMSFLTGTRPDTTSVYDLRTKLRSRLPNAISLPQHFRENGYWTKGIGKVWHRNHNDPLSWSIEQPWVDRPHYALEENMRNAKIRYEIMMNGQTEKDIDRSKRRTTPPIGPIIELYDKEPQIDHIYTDGMITLATIESLKEAKDQLMKSNSNSILNSNLTSKVTKIKGFFITAGYMKPHLPWCLPKHYYDDVNLSSVPFLSDELYNCPVIARCSLPLNSPKKSIDIPGTEMSMYLKQKDMFRNRNAMQNMRRAYAACVKYIDKQIGILISSLKDLKLNENTMIVVFSDHGYKLGEHGGWSKGSNVEEDTRVPLLFNIPPSFHQHSSSSSSTTTTTSTTTMVQEATSMVHEGIVELVDIFPTLIDLCKLPPLPIGSQKLEGKSLSSLLLKHKSSTEVEKPTTLCRPAFSQALYGSVMGYSMRLLDCDKASVLFNDQNSIVKQHQYLFENNSMKWKDNGKEREATEEIHHHHHGRHGYRLTVWIKYGARVLPSMNSQQKEEARVEVLAQVLKKSIPFEQDNDEEDSKVSEHGNVEALRKLCTIQQKDHGWMSQVLRTHITQSKSSKSSINHLEAYELYDLSLDPYETVNVAQEDDYAHILGVLICKWVAGWQGGGTAYI